MSLEAKIRTKVLFIIPALDAGGAQKVLSILLQKISKDIFDCTLCVLTSQGEFYNDVPQEVTKIYLNTSRVRYAAFKLYRFIKKLNPELVFVFDVNNMNLVIALLSFFLPAHIKFITREAVILSSFLDNYPLVGIRKFLYKLAFKRFDTIISQSNYMRQDLVVNFSVNPEKIVVINNPISIKDLSEAAMTDERLLPENVINLIAVGRIVYIKGYDLLIEALAKVTLSNFHLTILGEQTTENPGYRDYVLNLVSKYGLTEKVTFLGFTNNPYKYIKQSDLMLITSRTEAFSNAAIEANALGIPILAFDSPGGMHEIIEENRNGWLVENGNIERLAKAITAVASLPVNKPAIIAKSVDKYDFEKIIPSYEKVMLDLLAK
ncbi:glycosyltransferase [Chryseosolibacter indicus]|uniref:Glycosyltransferase n=1 Tax=Chryseosolibacter indicus TaxID=2782351 RepID=A0ABS5VT20_9BACT|nr:glycosyltransferase [Chryseosolibacter indicus]MBT1704574.1 glycosyltransferase [Chryseosolibacter indicus]